jgi:CYTH domain-containing protein
LTSVSLDRQPGQGRRPGQGKYARAERERRWLVPSLPAGVGEPRRIEDRYLDGTSLRLRRVEDAGAVVFKLGQKIRADAGDPFLVWVTNLYLTAEEHQRLSALPAAVLVKTRRLARHGGVSFAVDEFSGPLQGLLLAETELAETELAEIELAEREELPDALPQWLGPEVTREDRYSGAALARDGRPR